MLPSTHLTQFQLMAAYNSRSNRQMYDLVASLPAIDRQRDLGSFFKSIEGTLNHILLGDRAWLGRFATGTDFQFSSLQNTKLVFEFADLSDILCPDFDELRREREATDMAIESWLLEIDPAALAAKLSYQNVTRKVHREHSLWFGIAHLFNHQTHHRGQISTMLSQLGYDYGVTDFIAMYDPDLMI
jgi:uncharacterized damage-inducible protein DinB